MTGKFQTHTVYQAFREKAEQLIGDDKVAIPDKERKTLVHLARELEIQQVDFEAQIQELRGALRDLEASREEYVDLYRRAPVAFLTLSPIGVIEKANQAAARLLGGADGFLIGSSFSRFVLPGDHHDYFVLLRNLAHDQVVPSCELRLRTQSNDVAVVHLEAKVKHDGLPRKVSWRLAMVDITRQRQAEEALRNLNATLEQKVAERTVALSRANRNLREEVAAKEKARKALKEQSDILKIQKESLKEANTALQVVLESSEANRRKMEERLLLNVSEIVQPFVRRIKASRLSRRQRAWVESLERSLQSVTAPMTRHLTLNFTRLSPTEIQVAELIRQRKSSKEIAETLNVAKSTVDYHRDHIRKKLGLNKQKTNLQSFLQSLPRTD